MINKQHIMGWSFASFSAVGAAATGVGFWNPDLSAGVLVGGLWGMSNLWCLACLLRRLCAVPSDTMSKTGSSPEPRRRWSLQRARPLMRSIGWALVKFPLLYFAIYYAFAGCNVSPEGFGIGFILVLSSAVAASILVLHNMAKA